MNFYLSQSRQARKERQRQNPEKSYMFFILINMAYFSYKAYPFFAPLRLCVFARK
jgi:hypothetical protein